MYILILTKKFHIVNICNNSRGWEIFEGNTLLRALNVDSKHTENNMRTKYNTYRKVNKYML